MKPRLQSAPLTTEDFAILSHQWTGRGFTRPWLIPIGHSYGADLRDADAMLIMVELHASRVVQAATGDWCYFGHSSQSVFQGETLQ